MISAPNLVTNIMSLCSEPVVKTGDTTTQKVIIFHLHQKLFCMFMLLPCSKKNFVHSTKLICLANNIQLLAIILQIVLSYLILANLTFSIHKFCYVEQVVDTNLQLNRALKLTKWVKGQWHKNSMAFLAFQVLL